MVHSHYLSLAEENTAIQIFKLSHSTSPALQCHPSDPFTVRCEDHSVRNFGFGNIPRNVVSSLHSIPTRLAKLGERVICNVWTFLCSHPPAYNTYQCLTLNFPLVCCPTDSVKLPLLRLAYRVFHAASVKVHWSYYIFQNVKDYSQLQKW